MTKYCPHYPQCQCVEDSYHIHERLRQLNTSPTPPTFPEVTEVIAWAHRVVSCIAVNSPNLQARLRAQKELQLPVYDLRAEPTWVDKQAESWRAGEQFRLELEEAVRRSHEREGKVLAITDGGKR